MKVNAILNQLTRAYQTNLSKAVTAVSLPRLKSKMSFWIALVSELTGIYFTTCTGWSFIVNITFDPLNPLRADYDYCRF